MPRQDGTGPEGKGPLTGRRMGNCEQATPRRGLGFFRFGRKNPRNFQRKTDFNNNNNN